MRNRTKRNKRRNKKKYIKTRKQKIYLGGSVFTISSNTTNILNNLNNLLQKKCSNLEIRIGMMNEMPGEIYAYSKKLKNSMLICLYYDDNCISSIQLIQEDGAFELRSFTNKIYEGNKYNTLLRNVLMVIGNTITFKGNTITKVMSYATNPISSYLIMKNFNVLPLIFDSYGNKTDFGYFINEYESEGKTNDINIIIQEFYKNTNSVPIIFEIPLTDEALNNRCLNNFKMIVDEIKCLYTYR